MTCRDPHETVTTRLSHRALARHRQRLIWARKWDAIDDHKLTSRARHIDPLPQRQVPNRLACSSAMNRRVSSGSCASPWHKIVSFGSRFLA